MTSSIDVTKPVAGIPTTASVRQNFTYAKSEIEALQTAVSTLQIGTQPLDATLTALAAVITAADKLIYATGADAFSTTTLTSFGRSVAACANAAALLTLAGAQPSDATLTALAAVTTAADKIIYATGTDTFSTTDFTTLGRTLAGLANAAAGRTALGVVIGTDVEAHDATLTALAGVTTAANKLIYATGSDAFATTDISAFGRSLIDDADATAGLATLGVSIASQADMESASSLTALVTAGRINHAPGVMKAGINFNGTGTIAARVSLNVASLTDNGTGDYTITLTTGFSSANYIGVATCGLGSAGAGGAFVIGPTVVDPTSTAWRLLTANTSIVTADSPWINVAFFGDQ